MIVYLFSLIISLIFTNKAYEKNNLLFHITAIVFPIVLYTFRGTNVGTDTFHYEDLYFNAQYAYGYLEFIFSSRIEYGFSTLLYLSSKTGLSVQFAFFIMALFTIGPIYLGIYILRDKISPCFALALYYLMFYQYSFNIARQSIAMSLLFLSLSFLLTNRNKSAFAFAIVSILFHNVAVLVFPLFLVYLLKDKNIKQTMVFIVVIIVGLFYFGQEYLSDSIDYYDNYLSSDKASTQFSYLIEMGINATLVFLWWNQSNAKENGFALFISLFVFFLIACSSFFDYAFRIACCYDIFLIAFVPMAISSIKYVILNSGYLYFAFFFWWFVFIYNNSGGTYPYSF